MEREILCDDWHLVWDGEEYVSGLPLVEEAQRGLRRLDGFVGARVCTGCWRESAGDEPQESYSVIIAPAFLAGPIRSIALTCKNAACTGDPALVNNPFGGRGG